MNKLKCFVIPRGKHGKMGRKIASDILDKYHYLGSFKGRGKGLTLIWHDTIRIKEHDIPKDLVAIVVFSYPLAVWLPDRDRWIGWTDKQRLKNLNRKMVDEVRFLILPHIKIPNLASQILAASCKIVRREWKARYGDNLVLVTCFTNPKLYKGHSYYGAGFKLIGHTKDGKRILAKPLKSYFREELNR